MECTWDMLIENDCGKSAMMTSELLDRESPLIIGMDVQSYCNTLIIDKTSRFVLQRPNDTSKRTFLT